MMTDPLADMITRIRNAGRAGHAETTCPASRLKRAVASVLKESGYLEEVVEEDEGPQKRLRIRLRYDAEGEPMIDGIRRISRPSRRVYVAAADVPRVRNGLGVAVISTNAGVMSDDEARARSVGGEVVCEVW